MSHHAAGKVYFVLYLAVILELLIIIVERDEAEEHLRKKEREAREIIQDIVGQMQIGRGDENLSARITDEISLLSDEAIKISGIPYKKYRTYNIEVGVNDGNSSFSVGNDRADTLEHERLVKRLANVEDLQYEILYSSDNSNEAPPVDSSTGIWKKLATLHLQFDTAATTSWKNPVYKISGDEEQMRQFAPPMLHEQPLYYNDALTETFSLQNNGKWSKRFFTADFQPNNAGWYKLRFTSRTHRILGIGGDVRSLDEINEDTKITIGGMQLTVKKLKKLHQMLNRELEVFGIPTVQELAAAGSVEDAARFFARLDTVKQQIFREKQGNEAVIRDLQRKVDVYGDVAKLITPNKSQYFNQNHGMMEITVRVTKPPVAIVQAHLALPSEVYCFDKIKPAFSFAAGPFYGNNFPTGELITSNGTRHKLLIERKELVASAAPVTEKGDAVQFMARSIEPITPGVYTIELSHRSQGDTKTEKSTLRVFPSRLVKNNQNMIDNRLKSLYYGSTVSHQFIPDSEDRIPANQFRVYAGLQNLPQTPVVGLLGKVPLEAKARKVVYRVTWVSSYTGEEVEIFPQSEGTIKQRTPDIDLSKVAVGKISGTADRVQVQIQGIVVSPSIVDVGGKTGADQDVDDVQISNVSTDALGMEIDDVRLIPNGSGVYSALITLVGKPSKKPVEISGNLLFTIQASIKNPLNAIRSASSSWQHTQPFSYTTPVYKGKQ